MADDQNKEGQTPAPDVKPEEEMTQEELDALHADEEFIENFDPADLADEAKRSELEKRLGSAKTTLHQKRHYQGIVKAGKPAKPGPAAPAAPAAKPEGSTGSTGPAATEEKGLDPQVVTDFRIDHPELTKDQQKKVIEHAKAYKILPEDALNDPLIKSYIASTTTAEDVDEASPAPGHRSGGAIGDRDWSSASPKDMEEARRKILYPNG